MLAVRAAAALPLVAAVNFTEPGEKDEAHRDSSSRSTRRSSSSSAASTSHSSSQSRAA